MSLDNLQNLDETSIDNKVLTVGQLNFQVKALLESQIGQIWVRGELSNFKAHTSGHFYFSLKDAQSQISAVMFRGSNSKLKFKPQDGLEVIVRARISVYEPRGQYQIVCESMEPVGAGALQKAFETLKLKLKNEGLFEAGRKMPLPAYPQNIAIVTSPTGAAIRDILNIIARRAPFLNVTVVPTIVQGDAAPEKIRQALKLAMKIPQLDVIIIGRGGGSIEDLWAFNDEELARDIAACPFPIISAVGHEIDFTICDFVSDLRAPTPSAAAELVARSSQEIIQKILQQQKVIHLYIHRKIATFKDKVRILSKSLVDPKVKLQDLQIRNDDLLNRIFNAIKEKIYSYKLKTIQLQNRLIDPQQIIEQKKVQQKNLQVLMLRQMQVIIEKHRSRLLRNMEVIDSLSPLKVVSRGYSIVESNHKVIKSFNEIKIGEQVSIQLANGAIVATVDQLTKEGPYGF
ncbi:MAG: exodeoxyribonuclease VII large subunit [Pseudobdellovibrionaceae bacterium]